AKDIERLQARSSQPSPWQLQNIAIQNIQEFLHSYEREHPANGSDLTQNLDNNMSLTRRQLMIHEVIMTLNLATQASNMREKEQLVGYFRQARKQLQTLVPQTSKPKIISTDNKTSQTANSTTANKDKVQTKSSPNDITEVIDWLDRLIANAPKPTPLLT